MSGDYGDAKQREMTHVKDGDKKKHISSSSGSNMNGSDVAAPWLEDHGLWSSSSSLCQVTPTRPPRRTVDAGTTSAVRAAATPSRTSLLATPTPVHRHTQEHVRHSEAEVTAPTTVGSSTEVGSEAHGHNSPVATPQRQQLEGRDEEEGRQRSSCHALSASSSPSLPAHEDTGSRTAVCDGKRGGGGEAAGRSLDLHRAGAGGASDGAEKPLSVVLQQQPPLQHQQEESALLPSLVPMPSSSAKQSFATALPALGTGPLSPHVISHGEERASAKQQCTGVAAVPAVVAASARAPPDALPSSSLPRAWTSCAHSDLPARYRDVPGYYCTYCSYTVCTDCLPLTHLQEQSRLARISAPSSVSSSAASTSSTSGEMDWLDAVIASPATAVRGGGDHRHALQQGHLTEGGSLRNATTTSSSSTATAPLRCHLCRRGELVREEALLHEWCCEGPTPVARLHGGGSLVYDTENLHKYHFMRAQREKRLSSTEPLLAQVLAVSPATLGGDGCSGDPDARADRSAPCVTQSPLRSHHHHHDAPRTVLGKHAAFGRDPLPSASSVPGRRSVLSRVGAEPSAAAALRDGAALPLDRCEEGGSFTFSVWNPRMETQLVWCAVNREAREEAPAYRHPHHHSASGHRGRGALPPSASVTPLFMWRCPPSLPGLTPRPFRLAVPYGLYAFANTHALALYVASDIFKKATTQLAAAPGGGDGTQHVQVHPQQLSSVKMVPSATLRALLIVNVMHHVATTPRPLLLGREPPAREPRPKPERHLNRQHPMQPPSSSTVARKRHRMDEGGAEGAEGGRSSAAPDAEVSTSPPTADLQWPHGLASPELALCVDHLLHGRSVAVYGIGSKYFFLHHVAQSAQLKHFTLFTVDASAGRGSGGVGNANRSAATSASVDPHDGGQSGRRSGGGGGSASAPGRVAAAPSIARQLIAVGSTLVKRVRSKALRAEIQLLGHNAMTPRRQPLTEDARQLQQQTPCAAALPAERAALTGEEARSPAVARDVTSAMQRTLNASRTSTNPVNVVDVDSGSSSSDDEWRMNGALGKPRDRLRGADGVTVMPAHGTARELGRSPVAGSPQATATAATGMATPNTSRLKTQQHQRCSPSPMALVTTPFSQRGTHCGGADASSPASSSLPLMSPVPAFFDVLQRTVFDSLEDDVAAGADEDAVGGDALCRIVCAELPEYAGSLHSLKLPPLSVAASSHRGSATSELSLRAPALRFASDAVRQLVLKSVRRRQSSRRCVQWVSLPSTTALAVLAEQMPLTTPAAPPRLYLSEAHQLRPGWSPPVLLVLHSVDLLDTEEAGLLLQLCAEFAYPHPHLQLLLSFDDPRWPLTPLAGALERMGVCAVQLRSLLLPRVHEMQYVSSVRLLTDSEVMAAGGAGSLGLKATGHGASAATGAGGLASAGGGSPLLHDTMRRVLFSLPPAFSGLLRILIDAQEAVGEGAKISVFVAKERFEQHGVMVSQGRLKALLQELTSNRIAQYDTAEHALTVMQPRKLRKVLDEVAAERNGAVTAAAATGAPAPYELVSPHFPPLTCTTEERVSTGGRAHLSAGGAGGGEEGRT
ncbi:hypothetical protein JIQ42_08472 [Leishmania sp. Namibia]|uniref:hypothetical protein n=1 Tax=Leishmania sp. Namibia TaxID=2802991 RepID=UPI001B6E7C15|nr:hypothetical protein JIQ42_08472 [Leishmania sp. Namibia]